ncbi:hypothetical protein D8770_25190 [Methylobacterium sp. DB1607]|nr:hypothetical protein [Methylobacterium sp. DB1607]
MDDSDAAGPKRDPDITPKWLQGLNLDKFVLEAREAASVSIRYRSSLEQAAEAQAKPAGTSASEKFQAAFSSMAKD